MIILQRMCSPFKKIMPDCVDDYNKDHYYLTIDENTIRCIQLDKQEIACPDLDVELVAKCIVSGLWTEVTEPRWKT